MTASPEEEFETLRRWDLPLLAQRSSPPEAAAPWPTRCRGLPPVMAALERPAP